MTKKDYIKFADMFKKCHKALGEKKDITAKGMLQAIERDIADIFLEDNARFDYGRFMDYINH